MFLRRHRRRKGEETYENWTLVQSVRTVACLGKLPELDARERFGWERAGAFLEGRPEAAGQGEFWEKPREEEPRWAMADVKGLRVERVRGSSGRCLWAWRCGGGWGGTSFWAGF